VGIASASGPKADTGRSVGCEQAAQANSSKASRAINRHRNIAAGFICINRHRSNRHDHDGSPVENRAKTGLIRATLCDSYSGFTRTGGRSMSTRTLSAAQVVAAIALLFATDAAAAGSRCDLDSNGRVDANDVRLLQQVAMRRRACPAGKQCNIDGRPGVNIYDLQLLSNVAAGRARCPLDPAAPPTQPPPPPATPPAAQSAQRLFECFHTSGKSSRLVRMQGNSAHVFFKTLPSFSTTGWPPSNWPAVLPRLNYAPNLNATATVVGGNPTRFQYGSTAVVVSQVQRWGSLGIVAFREGPINNGFVCHLVEGPAVATTNSMMNFSCPAHMHPGPGNYYWDERHLFRLNNKGGVVWRRHVRVNALATTYYGASTGAWTLKTNGRVEMKFLYKPVVNIGSSKTRDGHLPTHFTGWVRQNGTIVLDRNQAVSGACVAG